MLNNSVLFVVDVQSSFAHLDGFPDELPVPGALEVVQIINKLLTLPWKYKFATQDWHPRNHCSFKDQGGLYPNHCVQNSNGSRFLPHLDQAQFNAIFRKGMRKDKDAFSVISEHHYLKQGLPGLDGIYLAGICMNICVFETAMDLSKHVPHVPIFIVEDACVTLPLPEENSYCPSVVRKKAEENGICYIKTEEIK